MSKLYRRLGVSIIHSFSQQPQRPTVAQLKTLSSNTSSVVDRLANQRNQLNSRAKDIEIKSSDLQALNIGNSDIAIHLTYYMLHDCYKCQKADGILNYYQVSYERVQNMLYLQDIKKSNYIDLKSYDWPVLRVNSSLDTPKYFCGSDEITNYLFQSGLIMKSPHQRYDAWSLQGSQFVLEHINKSLELLFLNPFLTWQKTYKTTPEAFKKDGKTYRTITFLFKMISKGFSNSISNTFILLKNKEAYKQAKIDFHKQIEQFGERMQGQDYHGGTQPDEADFLLYGVLKAKHNSTTFKRYIENKFPPKMYSWFIRMQQNCRYEENRFYSSAELNDA